MAIVKVVCYLYLMWVDIYLENQTKILIWSTHQGESDHKVTTGCPGSRLEQLEVVKRLWVRRALLLMERGKSLSVSLSVSDTVRHTKPRTHNNRTTTNNVAHPSDSSQTCRARWLRAGAGRRPGSEWCCRWGHWEVSTWGWSGRKSWTRKWGPAAPRVLGRNRRNTEEEV